MRSFVYVAALLLTATPAAAYDARQEDVLSKLATALAISNRCPRLVVDETIAAPAMLLENLTMGDLDEVQARAERLASKFADRKVLDVCKTGVEQFGKNGSQLPDILMSIRPVLLAKRARFVAFAKATQERCADVVVQEEAIKMSELPPHSAFIVEGLIEEEQPTATATIAAMTCDEAIEATLKLTRLRHEQVFVQPNEN